MARSPGQNTRRKKANANGRLFHNNDIELDDNRDYIRQTNNTTTQFDRRDHFKNNDLPLFKTANNNQYDGDYEARQTKTDFTKTSFQQTTLLFRDNLQNDQFLNHNLCDTTPVLYNHSIQNYEDQTWTTYGALRLMAFNGGQILSFSSTRSFLLQLTNLWLAKTSPCGRTSPRAISSFLTSRFHHNHSWVTF